MPCACHPFLPLQSLQGVKDRMVELMDKRMQKMQHVFGIYTYSELQPAIVLPPGCHGV